MSKQQAKFIANLSREIRERAKSFGETAFIGLRRDHQPIGGTFTLSHGFVTSAPLRFNASQKWIDRTMRELAEENRAVELIRAKRRRVSK